MILNKLTVMILGGTLSLSCLGAFSNNGLTVVKISAKRFEFTPSRFTLKKGVPVVLELSSEDRTHGFNIPLLNLRADILPGKVTELKFKPEKAGVLDFYCDVFCGSGHDNMTGKITVIE